MLQQETCRPKVIYGREALPAKEDVWMILFTVSLLLATDDKTFCVPCTAGSTRSFTGSCTSLHVKHYVSNPAAAATNSNCSQCAHGHLIQELLHIPPEKWTGGVEYKVCALYDFIEGAWFQQICLMEGQLAGKCLPQELQVLNLLFRGQAAHSATHAVALLQELLNDFTCHESRSTCKYHQITSRSSSRARKH
jgi:hypothetical protein